MPRGSKNLTSTILPYYTLISSCSIKFLKGGCDGQVFFESIRDRLDRIDRFFEFRDRFETKRVWNGYRVSSDGYRHDLPSFLGRVQSSVQFNCPASLRQFFYPYPPMTSLIFLPLRKYRGKLFYPVCTKSPLFHTQENFFFIMNYTKS